jgi:hypothetical protein
LTHPVLFPGGKELETNEAVEYELNKLIAFEQERGILMRVAVWYVTTDFGVATHAKAIGDLAEGLEDVAFYAGRDVVLRQELTYVSQIAGELQKKTNDLLHMLPRERRVKRGILNLGGKALKFLFRAALSEDLGPINKKS